MLDSQQTMTKQQKDDLYAETVARLRGSFEAWRDCAAVGVLVEPDEKLEKIKTLVDRAWLAVFPDERPL